MDPANLLKNKSRSSIFAPSKRISLRDQIASLSERRFDTKTLPEDLERVYHKLAKDFGEDYALTFVFMVRTGVELHRAWHMTLLTSNLLQQIKDKFKMRATWELGVIKLKFRVEDGGFELHRKVPYDYDSEYQDLYYKIGVALIEGHINIHDALIFQSNVKHGKHTAKSGLFLRDYPGRLILYPLEAATCSMIFFGGDAYDFGVTAVCGFGAGLTEWFFTWLGGDYKFLIDVCVGMVTGAIGGLFYRFDGQQTCLPAIFLGTLYWFFYGTAFVLGILEIAAGQLETGVIRFMAVSVKTFVLSLGTVIGMMIVVDNPSDAWYDGDENCNSLPLDEVWWRIPLYLACSATALGQYRFPIVHYTRGLIVQLVGYEVQYQSNRWLDPRHPEDFANTAASNILGAIAAVIVACALGAIVDWLGYFYNERLLHRTNEMSPFGEFMFNMGASYVRLTNAVGLGRSNDLAFLNMQDKLKREVHELNNPSHEREEIKMTTKEEQVLMGAIIGAEPLNVWALLMPTVYQMVPGSVIARLWFNSIFPPQDIEQTLTIEGTEFQYLSYTPDWDQENVFQNLMVVATSLAIGLMLGMGIVQGFVSIFHKLFSFTDDENAKKNRKGVRQDLMGDARHDDDPDSDVGEDDNDDSKVVDFSIPPLELIDTEEALDSPKTIPPVELVDTEEALDSPKTIEDTVDLEEALDPPKTIEDTVDTKEALDPPKRIEDTVDTKKALDPPKRIKDTVDTKEALHSPKTIEDTVDTKEALDSPKTIEDTA